LFCCPLHLVYGLLYNGLPAWLQLTAADCLPMGKAGQPCRCPVHAVRTSGAAPWPYIRIHIHNMYVGVG
jgi:hypothetical protein